MKTCFFSLGLLFVVSICFSQSLSSIDVRVQNLYNGALIDVYNLDDEKGQTTLYWRDEWARGTVKLKNGGKVDAFPLRFDLMGQGLEIFLGEEVRFLSTNMIDEFYLEGTDQTLHHFVNPPRYFGYEGSVDGFFEVLEEGPWTLLLKSEIEISNPTYTLGLEARKSNQTAISRDRYYIFHIGELIRIPKRRRKAIKVLSPLIPDIEIRVKAEKTNFNQLSALQLLVLDLNEKREDSVN